MFIFIAYYYLTSWKILLCVCVCVCLVDEPVLESILSVFRKNKIIHFQ